VEDRGAGAAGPGSGKRGLHIEILPRHGIRQSGSGSGGAGASCNEAGGIGTGRAWRV
jgi:hypothetical protein